MGNHDPYSDQERGRDLPNRRIIIDNKHQVGFRVHFLPLFLAMAAAMDKSSDLLARRARKLMVPR
jgi:hypothetical protein